MGDTMGSTTPHINGAQRPKQVLFFDIDNCLYPKKLEIFSIMAEKIDDYFVESLSLTREDAISLHANYYQSYGLAIEGLVRHHKVDALDYNSKVDDALPLEDIIKRDPSLRRMLEDIDRSKVRLWLFTNAYITHARRVVRLLGIEDLFEGMTYCDYATVPLVCKPHKDMFEKAMRDAGVEDVNDCFFVDDSYSNCRSAQELGWTAAHLVEEGLKVPKTKASKHQIRQLEELRSVFSQFFRPEDKDIDT